MSIVIGCFDVIRASMEGFSYIALPFVSVLSVGIAFYVIRMFRP